MTTLNENPVSASGAVQDCQTVLSDTLNNGKPVARDSGEAKRARNHGVVSKVSN